MEIGFPRVLNLSLTKISSPQLFLSPTGNHLSLSRTFETFMESNNSKNTETIKFLCSYGGKILPRYTDGTLRYAGGLTRVLAVDRSISFTGLFDFPFPDLIFCELVWFLWIINQFIFVVAELMVKLGEFCGSSVSLRCQLPTSDLGLWVCWRWIGYCVYGFISWVDLWFGLVSCFLFSWIWWRLNFLRDQTMQSGE